MGLFGFASAALALSAGSASATLVCPPGTTGPAYCRNVLPVATTSAATHVGPFTAIVNGVAGPGVKNGDVTRYYFQYGTTRSYRFKTATGVIGSCPPGATNPAYCKVPVTKAVSARLFGLTPNTVYHYRIVAVNPDGTTKGKDRTFRTSRVDPIQSVSAPRSVRHGKKFTVKVVLRVSARVTISLRFGRHTLVSFSEGRRSGTIRQRFTAPTTTGNYTIRVVAVGGGKTETVNSTMTVF